MPPKISDKTPGEKLLALYTLLMFRGDRHISLASLADTLTCSKQTVLRLLAQLEASGFGKLEEPLRRGKEDFYRLAKVDAGILDVGAQELAQLALCRKLLLNFLPDKVQALSSEEADIGKTGHAVIMYKGFIDYAPVEDQYSKFLRAIQKKPVCQITYRKSIFKEPREFFYAPMRIISYRKSIAIIGWETTARGNAKSLYPNWLWLYLQRCSRVELTGRTSRHLPPINLKTGPDAGFGIMDRETFRVKLAFDPGCANYVYDRKWADDQSISIAEDGNLLLEMSVRSKPEIISWILSFGAGVKVLAPASLREEIIEKANCIINGYQDI